MNESGEIAAVNICYRIACSSFRERIEQITNIAEALEEVRRGYDVYGRKGFYNFGGGFTADTSVLIELIQEPRILRAALEDLFSKAGPPQKVFYPAHIFRNPDKGYDSQGEELGIRIVQELLKPHGLLLEHCHSLDDYHVVKKKKS